LSSAHSAKVQTAKVSGSVKPVIFMFPGQGSQYINMGLELYREEQGFREEVDQCCHILARLRGYDMKEILYPAHIWEGTNERIHQTSYTQPAIFIFEYALARMLMNWGIRPDGMIGHSLGEYVAACLSGVLSLEHALALVSAR
ncbi:acyltransferase domain-containing protein, partial [Paenibacillus sepulcri]|nr:acyltransferase domain-containing protein [Paenibacillus sepulcri]